MYIYTYIADFSLAGILNNRLEKRMIQDRDGRKVFDNWELKHKCEMLDMSWSVIRVGKFLYASDHLFVFKINDKNMFVNQ